MQLNSLILVIIIIIFNNKVLKLYFTVKILLIKCKIKRTSFIFAVTTTRPQNLVKNVCKVFLKIFEDTKVHSLTKSC